MQRFTLIGLLATAACAAAISLAATRYEVADQLDHFAQKAAITATYLLAPTVRPDDFDAPTPARVDRWNDRLKQLLDRTDVLRVKVFNPDGTLVYSDEPALIGKKVDLAEEEEFREAIRGEIAADVGHGRHVDKSGVLTDEPLLEVYVPVLEQGSGRVVGIYEVYQDYAPIAALTARIQRTAWGASFLAFALLFLSLYAVVRAASRQLVFMAYHDPLTGVANRHSLRDRLQRALSGSKTPGKQLALLYLDLARFKAVNDSLGHRVGDELLRSVAERLARPLVGSELLARVGGDEFVVLLPEVASEEDATRRAAGLLATLDAPFNTGSGSLRIGASVGITLSRADDSSWEDLITRADIAMYHAKQAGTGVEAYRPRMLRYTRERLELEENLRRALDEGTIRPVYQPIVSLPEGEIVGAEVLARWDEPGKGPIAPGVFIPVAEETGMIRRLDRYMTERAVKQAMEWHAAGQTISVAVNISAATFAEAGFTDFIAAILRTSKLPPRYLTLEITERVLLEGDTTRDVLTTLSKIGVRIALDDFGTGYSSLSYLQNLPIDVIKIDRSFVQQIDTSGGGDAIVRTIIDLADNLGVAALAEGIEQQGQASWLSAHGCSLGQGYYLGRPVEAGAFSTVKHEQEALAVNS